MNPGRRNPAGIRLFPTDRLFVHGEGLVTHLLALASD